MAEQDIKMDMKKILSDKGEEHLFNAIKNLICWEIQFHTGPVRGFSASEQKNAREKAEKAEEDLKAVIFALEWRHK